MSMELIDRNEMLANILCIACGDKDVSVKWLNEYVGNYPTVKAIPLDRVEQIREHFEAIAHFNGTVKADYVLNMLDKALKEQTT